MMTIDGLILIPCACDITSKMIATIKQRTNMELKVVIRFLYAKGKNETEIVNILLFMSNA